MHSIFTSAATNGETEGVEWWKAKGDVDVCEEASVDDRRIWMMRI